MNALNHFVFGIYPYLCLTVFFAGSLIRFDRDQYLSLIHISEPTRPY